MSYELHFMSYDHGTVFVSPVAPWSRCNTKTSDAISTLSVVSLLTVEHNAFEFNVGKAKFPDVLAFFFD